MSGQEENQKYQIPFGKNQPWANKSAGDSTPSGGSGISAGNAGGNSSDNAQQIYYFNNQVVAPTGTYTYDALYRLISATGRELNSLGMPSHEDFPNDIPCPNPMANAMQNYTQYYRYDELGNILQLQSDGNQSHWIRDYIYDTATNRLLRHSGTTDEYRYDQHGNITSMPHLHFLRWDYKDQFYNTSNGTYSSFYSYDAQGNRTRKVIDKNNIIETIYYIDGFELYRREVNGAIDYERTTLNISDNEKVFVRVEKKTNEPEVVRYQYDNHLGSACLELDYTGRIISYEEYHPFGTTSYRSGRSETEVSLKRYKYCGKERDEQTGFYYYGMRYYAAWLCRFVSVDPLADEYPGLTPYNYCLGNPVILVDPDGNKVKPINGISKAYIKEYFTKQFGTDKMFRYNSQGYLKINKKEYNQYMSKASLSQSRVLSGIKTVIDRKEIVHIGINENSGKFTMEENKIIASGLSFERHYIKKFIDIGNSSGVTIGLDKSLGNLDHYIFINNAIAQKETVTGHGKIGKDDYNFYETGADASSVLIHELLDEFLNYYINKNQNKSDTKYKYDRVQYQNDALQNVKKRIRDGADHE